MSIRSRSKLSANLILALTAGVSLLIATPLLAQPVLYTGTMRIIVRTGQVPNNAPSGIPTFGGALNQTPSGGISVFPGDADWSTSYTVSNPPTFAGVLQQTSFLTVMNAVTATAKPGNGPGPFTFAHPSPTGGPPFDPTFGVSKRLGAVSMPGGAAQFGGTFPFLWNFVAHLVFYGGGGGNPNLACPAGVQGEHGASGTIGVYAQCIGLTTGPLPAMTLPSVMVDRFNTLTLFPATTGPVFAAAPAPITATTLTAVGSDVRNTAGTTGMIQLIAPFLFSGQSGGSGNPAGQNQAAALTEWKLTLLPEPGMLMALSGGLVGLVGLRFAERRRRG